MRENKKNYCNDDAFYLKAAKSKLFLMGKVRNFGGGFLQIASTITSRDITNDFFARKVVKEFAIEQGLVKKRPEHKQTIEDSKEVKRFWECFRAIEAANRGKISGKDVYAEAKRQLGYEPPKNNILESVDIPKPEVFPYRPPQENKDGRIDRILVKVPRGTV